MRKLRLITIKHVKLEGVQDINHGYSEEEEKRDRSALDLYI